MVSLINNTDISTITQVVMVCMHTILASAVASVALYLYHRNKGEKAAAYLMVAAGALFVWNTGYALEYMFSGSFFVACIIRFVAEGGMIAFFTACVHYVRYITSDRYNSPYWLTTLHKAVLTLFWLVFSLRGILYPLWVDNSGIYLRLIRIFRLPAVIFMIGVMAYMARICSEWKKKIRFKRDMAIARMIGDFAALMIVAAILDIVFPKGYPVDTYSFSAFIGVLAAALLTVVTVYYLDTALTMSNALQALKGDIPTPLIILAGEETKIVDLNAAALRFLGRSEEEIK